MDVPINFWKKKKSDLENKRERDIEKNDQIWNGYIELRPTIRLCMYKFLLRCDTEIEQTKTSEINWMQHFKEPVSIHVS